MPHAHRDRARAGGSYDPNGPFTGDPHDDRPEVVTSADLEAENDKEPEITEGSTVTPDDAQVVSPDATVTPGYEYVTESDVPARADQVEAWIDKAPDHADRARRIGAALRVERARQGGPRTTVLSRLEALQRELRQP